MKLISHLCLAFLVGLSSASGVYCQNRSSAPPQKLLASKANKAYCRALDEYVKLVYKVGVPRPDTLFIGKDVDMPDIVLPGVIQGINTVLITSEDTQKKLRYRTSLVYLNAIGWVDNRRSDFLIFTFNEFKPQHNCSMRFSHNSTSDEMHLDSLSFQYPYGRKQ